MIKVRSLSAVLALGALAALPGCSMFGGGEHPAPAAAAAPAPAPAPAPPPPSNPAQNAMSRSLVRQVQTSLKQQNLYHGRIDGLWGPKTRTGVRQFQQKNNLQATGQLDDQTLQALNITAPSSSNTGGENMGNTSGGNMSGGMNNETGANGTNMPTEGGNMGTNTTGAGTGGTAAPAH